MLPSEVELFRREREAIRRAVESDPWMPVLRILLVAIAVVMLGSPVLFIALQ